MRHRYRWIIVPLLSLLLLFEIYSVRTILLALFRWATLGIILEFSLIIILWRFPMFKKLIGEGKQRKRSRFRLVLNWLSVLFLPLFSLYYLKSLVPGQLSATEQLSIIAIALFFSGLSLAAASIKGVSSEKRLELVCVSQKFILVVVLFILFNPLINILDQPPLNGIDVNSFDWLDPVAWWRGISFWLAALCFYGGFILFLFGIADLVFLFADIHIESDLREEVQSHTSESQDSTIEPDSSKGDPSPKRNLGTRHTTKKGLHSNHKRIHDR